MDVIDHCDAIDGDRTSGKYLCNRKPVVWFVTRELHGRCSEHLGIYKMVPGVKVMSREEAAVWELHAE